MQKFEQFLNFITTKYKLSNEILKNDFEEFVKEELKELQKSKIEDEFKNFLDLNEERLNKQFDIEHNFQTSTRGVKVKGCFPTQEEAELRSKLEREIDPNFDIFVGPVGVWLMVDPEAYKTGRTEYMEEELNKLMHEKIKNETNAKQEFEKRVKETKKKAIEENIKNAKKSGNVLTQDIDENGNLIGVNVTSQEKSFAEKGGNITTEEINKELFEGENIIMDTKNTDYGASALIGDPFGLNSVKK
jgi:hypothetical protein